MFDSNPSLIQSGARPVTSKTASSATSAKPVPIVLIHDGGGTIFSYYCLGELNRPVFGIANPRYESGATWEGGLTEMASQYVRFVKEAVPEGGDIILGGWSQGGVVSLELAKQLADDEVCKSGRLRVIGLVMVDSVCPLRGDVPRPPVVKHAMQWAAHTREETKARVLKCFENAVNMADNWTPLEWEGSELAVPPVVLLRAGESVPVVAAGIAKVDIHREEKHLGWDVYKKDLITKVIPIPGHHYNLFHTDENMRATTEAIKQACRELEVMNNNSKKSFA
ncbi:Alpha/Beta hydrolase protein [Staphylotrichum tortipilum]|uniref:Alpha/Beta hydrolase protein n=1 Tax=Staphylotrichum tortipilum TaxID=2831512 RepID=A0AAN6MNB8_9PEZI|nr:Alpha/Beta hydrolase protein [Staphylotrichum longicolle]